MNFNVVEMNYVISTIQQPFNQQISEFIRDKEWNDILENFLRYTSNVSSFLRVSPLYPYRKLVVTTCVACILHDIYAVVGRIWNSQIGSWYLFAS